MTLFLVSIPRARYDYSHFIAEETKAQRSEVTCLNHTAGKMWSWDLNPGLLTAELMLSTIVPATFTIICQVPGPLTFFLSLCP